MGGDAIDLVGAELGYLSGPLLGGREELREGNLEVGQLLACLAFIFDAREHYQGGSSLVHGRERNSRLAAEQRLDEVHVDPLRGKRPRCPSSGPNLPAMPASAPAPSTRGATRSRPVTSSTSSEPDGSSEASEGGVHDSGRRPALRAPSQGRMSS